jgi:hypothetical protein
MWTRISARRWRKDSGLARSGKPDRHNRVGAKLSPALDDPQRPPLNDTQGRATLYAKDTDTQLHREWTDPCDPLT